MGNVGDLGCWVSEAYSDLCNQTCHPGNYKWACH